MCCDEKTSEKEKDTLSPEQEEQMWAKMMDCCCSDMMEEDKQKWMEDMKKKMHHMKGHMGAMMGIKHHGMGFKHGRSPHFMAFDMCKEMMSSIKQSHRVATLATPEVQGLFEDWVEQIEQEMLDFLKDKTSVDPLEISKHFKISKESAYYFLTRLAQKSKVDFNLSKEKDR
jgi:hypothetical protein